MVFSSYQILYDVDRILRQHGVLYWLTRSTLLGAIEIGGLFKGDRDIDICVEKKYAEILRAINWEKCDYHLLKTGKNYKVSSLKMKKVPAHDYSCCPYIDIHIMKDVDGKFLPYNNDTDFFLHGEVFPLKRIPMQSFLVFAPKDPKIYLDRTFGKRKKMLPLDKNFKIVRRVCLNMLSSGKMGSSPMNIFFDKIFIINLHDQTERLKGITERLREKNVHFIRFDAVDGRCKSDVECSRKRLALEREYKVRIPKHMDLPPASLTLGTFLILKEAIRNKWKRVCIMEDDATLVDNFMERFEKGVKELEKVAPDWDLLFLGCTQMCGSRGISREKTERNKHLTSIHKFVDKADFYVEHPDDVRVPCPAEKCVQLSENLSKAYLPGGNFGYALSQKGIKKLYKIIGGNIDDHIDGIIEDAITSKKMKAVSFDPPIVNHFGGADRPDTNLEWSWNVEYE